MLPVRNVSRDTLLCRQCVRGTSFWLRLRGLMFRRAFAPFDGLWLAPTAEIHMFWVWFPIDLVWLDRALTVLRVTHGIKPWRIERCPGAHSVLELPVGAVAASGTQVGDRLALGEE
jgi:uncharacterized membrane protein (UPF0127 family)